MSTAARQRARSTGRAGGVARRRATATARRGWRRTPRPAGARCCAKIDSGRARAGRARRRTRSPSSRRVLGRPADPHDRRDRRRRGGVTAAATASAAAALLDGDARSSLQHPVDRLQAHLALARAPGAGVSNGSPSTGQQHERRAARLGEGLERAAVARRAAPVVAAGDDQLDGPAVVRHGGEHALGAARRRCGWRGAPRRRARRRAARAGRRRCCSVPQSTTTRACAPSLRASASSAGTPSGSPPLSKRGPVAITRSCARSSLGVLVDRVEPSGARQPAGDVARRPRCSERGDSTPASAASPPVGPPVSQTSTWPSSSSHGGAREQVAERARPGAAAHPAHGQQRCPAPRRRAVPARAASRVGSVVTVVGGAGAAAGGQGDGHRCVSSRWRVRARRGCRAGRGRRSPPTASPACSASLASRSGASAPWSEVKHQYSVGPTRSATRPRPRVPLIHSICAWLPLTVFRRPTSRASSSESRSAVADERRARWGAGRAAAAWWSSAAARGRARCRSPRAAGSSRSAPARGGGRGGRGRWRTRRSRARPTRCQASSMSMIERPANSGAPAAGRACPVRGPVALDGVGDVLHDREHHRAAARRCGQRRVSKTTSGLSAGTVVSRSSR